VEEEEEEEATDAAVEAEEGTATTGATKDNKTEVTAEGGNEDEVSLALFPLPCYEGN
jgi:hypothetical protein